jgi:hypothetical protein
MCCALTGLTGLTGCGGSSGTSSTAQTAAQGGTSQQSATTQGASTATTTRSSGSHNAKAHGTRTRGASTTKPGHGSGSNGASAGGSTGGSGSARAAASTHDYGSLTTFGRQASGGDREAVLAAFHGYLSAIATGNWAAACARLSTSVKRELAQLLARAKGISGHGCATALGLLLGRAPVSVRRQQAQPSVVAVRTDGDHAFVLYRTAQLPHATLAMIREGGRWTAGVLSGATSG